MLVSAYPNMFISHKLEPTEEAPRGNGQFTHISKKKQFLDLLTATEASFQALFSGSIPDLESPFYKSSQQIFRDIQAAKSTISKLPNIVIEPPSTDKIQTITQKMRGHKEALLNIFTETFSLLTSEQPPTPSDLQNRFKSALDALNTTCEEQVALHNVVANALDNMASIIIRAEANRISGEAEEKGAKKMQYIQCNLLLPATSESAHQSFEQGLQKQKAEYERTKSCWNESHLAGLAATKLAVCVEKIVILVPQMKGINCIVQSLPTEISDPKATTSIMKTNFKDDELKLTIQPTVELKHLFINTIALLKTQMETPLPLSASAQANVMPEDETISPGLKTIQAEVILRNQSLNDELHEQWNIMLMRIAQANIQLIPYQLTHRFIEPMTKLITDLQQYQKMMTNLINNEQEKSKHERFLKKATEPLYEITDRIKKLNQHIKALPAPVVQVVPEDLDGYGIIPNGPQSDWMSQLQEMRSKHYAEHTKLYANIKTLQKTLDQLQTSTDEQFQIMNVAVQTRKDIDADFTQAYLNPIGKGVRVISNLLDRAANSFRKAPAKDNNPIPAKDNVLTPAIDEEPVEIEKDPEHT